MINGKRPRSLLKPKVPTRYATSQVNFSRLDEHVGIESFFWNSLKWPMTGNRGPRCPWRNLNKKERFGWTKTSLYSFGDMPVARNYLWSRQPGGFLGGLWVVFRWFCLAGFASRRACPCDGATVGNAQGWMGFSRRLRSSKPWCERQFRNSNKLY